MLAQHRRVGRGVRDGGGGLARLLGVAPRRSVRERQEGELEAPEIHLAYISPISPQGLIRGATAESALVCDRQRWLNGPLRFENEPARHKLLDLLGDLALLGALPCAHVVAWKARAL